MKSFITFTKLELINLFNLNVLRHTKDPAAKKRLMALTIIIVILALLSCGYLSGGAYLLALLGHAEIIPMTYSLLALLFTMFFGVFKAKSNLYRDRDIQLLTSLPVKSLHIAMARLLRSYVENAMLNALIIAPPFLICGIMGNFRISFYGNFLLALLILPILPTAVIAWIGILFSAIISRNRHKALTEAVLALITVVCVFLLPVLLSTGGEVSVVANRNFMENTLSEDAKAELSAAITETIGRMETALPLLKTWQTFFLGKNIPGFLAYGFSTIALLYLTAMVIGTNFFSICAKLAPVADHHDFRMTTLRQGGLTAALVQKEARRYFSCGIYFSNTIVTPVLAVIFAVALGFFDPAAILGSVGDLPVNLNLSAGIPFILGMIFATMTPAASSISIEGKNWWILQSLPITLKEILDAKLLFSLMLLSPFYVIAEIIMLFTVRTDLLGRLWLLFVPAVMILFTVTFGLFINLKFPNFNWENATQVVKQSAATGLSMLSIFVAILPGIILMILPGKFTHLAVLAAVTLIGALTLLLYKKISSSRMI